ncbi:MAG: general secretion pathway protein GspK, partial [Deltaproteobacteria bacterium]|nr:general secretion pathway protein GspK [Deltaproteobacteria bacterium]
MTPRAQRKKAINSNGIALLLVIWVLALLSVMVSEFCYTMRTEAKITRYYKEQTEARYMAQSGLNLATAALITKKINGHGRPKNTETDGDEDNNLMDLRINVDLPAVHLDKGYVKIRIDNDGGKVNINRANSKLIRLLFQSFDLTEQEQDIIVDSILDWRDKDDLHRINGAEDDYYQSLSNPYECKDGDFDMIEELLLVRGVTPDIYYNGLSKMVTVFQAPSPFNEKDLNKQTKEAYRLRQKKKKYKGPNYNLINLNAAPIQLLRAFPGMTDEMITEIVEYRMEKDFYRFNDLREIVGMDVYNSMARFLSITETPYYTIRSTGFFKDSNISESIEAVIEVNRKLKKKHRI